MRALEESERWMSAVRERRWEAVEGEAAPAPDAKRPFTLGWWAVSTWSPVYAEALAKAHGAEAGVWGPRIALIYTLGGVIAYMSSGFLADWIGRRAYLLLTFSGSLVITWMTYLWTGSLYVFALLAFLNGVITLGLGFSWMAIYPVELFTATVRSTAASVVFNGARLVAWVFPIIAGTLVAKFGGITNAALIISSIYVLGLIVPWFLPETRGKPLPH